MINWLQRYWVRNAPALILAASVIVLGSALASQYWGGLTPCKLCIWQRWPYVVTIAAAVLALIMFRSQGGRRVLMGVCAIAFAIGGCIAVYHAGVEQGWFPGPISCTGEATMAAQTVEDLRRLLLAQPVVRCDEIQWSLYGISMAGYNAIVSLILSATSLYAALHIGRMGRFR
ncbi:MAG: disulfide bond formation protein B [Rhodospirillales bacterium]|nr:disulfide bond formation protein B [Rhodospirillales bacterium]